MIKINVTEKGFTWKDGSITRDRIVEPNGGKEDILARGIISALKFANHNGELVVDPEFEGFINSLLTQDNLTNAAYVAAANLKYNKVAVHVGNKVVKFDRTFKVVTSNKTAEVKFTETGYKVKVGNKIVVAKPMLKKNSETEDTWKLRMLLSVVATRLDVGNYKLPAKELSMFKSLVENGKSKGYKTKDEFIASQIVNRLTEKKATMTAI